MKNKKSKYHELQKQIYYQFKDETLLDLALAHASVRSSRQDDNERMEFFGDRVLGLIVAENLFHQKNLPVGKMAQHLGYLVSRPVCAEITRKLALFEYAQLASNIKNDPQRHLSVYANICEALIAAIYLDGGLEAARSFIRQFWEHDLDSLDSTIYESSKNVLQETVQAHNGNVPAYEVISHSGPDHAPTFIVEVIAPPFGTARGEGTSRQIAEKNAAQNLLTHIRENGQN